MEKNKKNQKMMTKRTAIETEAFSELKKFCEENNIKIYEEVDYEVEDCDNGFRELTVEAPKGFCFGCGSHQYIDLVITPWFPDYAEMKTRIERNKVVQCEVEDCDWCNSED